MSQDIPYSQIQDSMCRREFLMLLTDPFVATQNVKNENVKRTNIIVAVFYFLVLNGWISLLYKLCSSFTQVQPPTKRKNPAIFINMDLNLYPEDRQHVPSKRCYYPHELSPNIHCHKNPVCDIHIRYFIKLLMSHISFSSPPKLSTFLFPLFI